MKNNSENICKQCASYKSAGEALKQLQMDFNDWSEMLTKFSVQAAYAIIAANWAVHGTSGTIASNWSKWSMIVSIAFLGINLFSTFKMSTLHYKQCIYAEEDSDRWNQEFENSAFDKHWPYTKNIEHFGKNIRIFKLWLPLVAAVLFIISAL